MATTSGPLSPPQRQRRVIFHRMNSSPCLHTPTLILERQDGTSQSDNEISEAEKSTKSMKSSSSSSLPPVMSCLGSNSHLLNENNSTTDTSQPQSSKNRGDLRRKVSFGHIKIREHPRALGDHPAVSSGPALSLGWYSEGNCPHSRTTELPLDEYEKVRGSPRSRHQIIIPRHKRQEILMKEVGLPYGELLTFQRETAQLKTSRKLAARSRLDEEDEDRYARPVMKMLQRVGRKLLRFHENEAQEHSMEQKQLDELMARAEAAERVRQQHEVAYWEAQRGGRGEADRNVETVDSNNNSAEELPRVNPKDLCHSASEPFFLSLPIGDYSDNNEPLEF